MIKSRINAQCTARRDSSTNHKAPLVSLPSWYAIRPLIATTVDFSAMRGHLPQGKGSPSLPRHMYALSYAGCEAFITIMLAESPTVGINITYQSLPQSTCFGFAST